MNIQESLGQFYLGRRFDLVTRTGDTEPFSYRSNDLLTHAVCVGMTGSGKTGLCIGLLEEAAMDGVPALIIDPKGDLTNLLLTFPDLSPADFRPWINEDEARTRNMSPDDYAAQQSQLWQQGLDRWGQGGERIRRLRANADFAIYTPGSSAGLPISLLRSFDAPDAAIVEDRELFAEQVNSTVSSLLGLLKINADPVQSREHILLANLLSAAWAEGQSLDLATLILQVQKPPMQRFGVMDVNTFYPERDRFQLAMAINNLIASPGFALWMEGEPMEIDRLLYTPEGRPRMAVLSIAHLGDAERMFFVSMLLNQTLSWMRRQSGTTSLRALLYMDEIFGYFPPISKPPSKVPLLSLLKQARAFGLGVVLATQNPVDLDYKGLANCGTWFIGRLQTENDKARLMEGLTSASQGQGFDRGQLNNILSSLGQRVFLLHNVHQPEPVLFETRWVMSYLRGPMTRDQIGRLMTGYRARLQSDLAGASRVAPPPPPPAANDVSRARPALPQGVPEFFLPATGVNQSCRYQAMLGGFARVRFSRANPAVDELQEISLLAPFESGAVPICWEHADEIDTNLRDLDTEPLPDAQFGALPNLPLSARQLKQWERDLERYLFSQRPLTLYRSKAFRLSSQAGESERDFRIRLQHAAHEQRDQQVGALRSRHETRLARLDQQIFTARQAVTRQSANQRKAQVDMVSTVGTSLLGALFGGGRGSKAVRGARGSSQAARGLGRTQKASQDLALAEDRLRNLETLRAELLAEAEAAADEIIRNVDPWQEELETISINPRKTDIDIRLVAVLWRPMSA
jgi:hypothetical protein